MSRTARAVVAGIPHQVTQRGNNRQDIFLNDRDRTRYLRLLHEEGCRRGLQVLAYCLMSNHVHLVNRFFSAAMDSSHTVAALEYVELHPRFAGMVDSTEDYFCFAAH